MNMISTAIGNTNMAIAQAAWLRSVPHHQIRVEAILLPDKSDADR